MDALTAYVESVKDTPFRWGQHDCVTFTNEALRIQTGAGYVENFDAIYHTPKMAHTTLLAHLGDEGGQTLLDALDSRLNRLKTTIPPKGSIVARKTDDGVFGWALGVAMTHRAAFIGADGLAFVVMNCDDLFWGIG